MRQYANKNKQHVSSNKTILFTMLSVPDYPIKIKAFAAQAICIILHDDQGIKAKWNSKVIAMLDDIRNKLINNSYTVNKADENINVDGYDRHQVYNMLIANKKQEGSMEEFYKEICIEALQKIST